ncbi:ATP-dependent RNA helicase HrpA [Aggregatibacter actinomycetemcomitans serotype e str. SC1083]|uniref:ATP-dependent RNA helicase HrpA n=2 Tax=Aggregatibacter actinomycetemcomitans TaxID=714 RepID=G4AAR0_AGGAC|nr:abortive infection family protein [Aggregatibacter actinomycetemcomitans]EGY32766.1 ATP-dependent RNA helicase HrpA [Aggregatibacter actinomycetemcomitans serotype e str. SC1083]KYK79783.1 RNA helicase [Aggregatibacter actinomycetemcomitans serotype e str. SC936]TYB21994.1 abortive infection family protein [Aggregatibacter actinomycetemcomitans]
MSKILIPLEIIAFLSRELPGFNSHTELDTLFLSAGIASDSISNENKEKKVQRKLSNINDTCPEPIQKLEILLNEATKPLMGNDFPYGYKKTQEENKKKFKEDIETELSNHGFTYINGKILPSKSLSPVSITLFDLIKNRDVSSINREFDRALKSLNTNPLDAISSACNILESILKFYISEKCLELPNTQILKELWKVVKEDFKFGLSKLGQDDLQKINSGITSIIDGVASIRTHESSAHGGGPESYIPEVRQARLVVNAAHSLAIYILETWEAQDSLSPSPKRLR